MLLLINAVEVQVHIHRLAILGAGTSQVTESAIRYFPGLVICKCATTLISQFQSNPHSKCDHRRCSQRLSESTKRTEHPAYLLAAQHLAVISVALILWCFPQWVDTIVMYLHQHTLHCLLLARCGTKVICALLCTKLLQTCKIVVQILPWYCSSCKQLTTHQPHQA